MTEKNFWGKVEGTVTLGAVAFGLSAPQLEQLTQGDVLNLVNNRNAVVSELNSSRTVPPLEALVVEANSVDSKISSNQEILQNQSPTTEILPAYQLTSNESKHFKEFQNLPIEFKVNPNDINFGSQLAIDSDSKFHGYYTQPTPEGKFYLAGDQNSTAFEGLTPINFIDSVQSQNPGAMDGVIIPFTDTQGNVLFVVPVFKTNREVNITALNKEKYKFNPETIFVLNPTTGKLHIVDQLASSDIQFKFIITTPELSQQLSSLQVADGSSLSVSDPPGSPAIIGVRKDNSIATIITDQYSLNFPEQHTIATPDAQYEVMSPGEIYPTPQAEMNDLLYSMQFLVNGKDNSMHKVTIGTNVKNSEGKILTIQDKNGELISYIQHVIDISGGTDEDLRIELRDSINFDKDMENWKRDGYKVTRFYAQKIDNKIPFIISVNSFKTNSGERIIPVFVGSEWLQTAANSPKIEIQAGIFIDPLEHNVQAYIDGGLFDRQHTWDYRPIGANSFGSSAQHLLSNQDLSKDQWWISFLSASYK